MCPIGFGLASRAPQDFEGGFACEVKIIPEPTRKSVQSSGLDPFGGTAVGLGATRDVAGKTHNARSMGGYRPNVKSGGAIKYLGSLDFRARRGKHDRHVDSATYALPD